MKFRILDIKSHKSGKAASNGMKILFASDDYCLEVDSDYVVAKKGTVKLICLGELSVVRNNKFNIAESKSIANILGQLINLEKMTDMQESTCGRYVLIAITGKTIRVIQDKFARADIYYTSLDSSVAMATDLSLLSINIKHYGYNQNALAHTLTYYGNRPAKKQTIYSVVNRLGVSESIELNQNGMSVNVIEFKPRQVRKYTKKENDIYADLFLQTLQR